MKRLLRGIAAAAVTAMLMAGAWTGMPEKALAGGETRTLSLYHVHTKENLQVTYKVNGRYVPSALAKINRLMRDWRRNETVKMDPETIDLMWELHADLGSRRPIFIICGYRSSKTNSFLKRIGRNVARKSQHTRGKAIDLYFPDVSTEKIRNNALVRQVGGVGYYRSSGPSGFVHIDSGNVRHWPRMSPSKLAKIFRETRSKVGRYRSQNDRVVIAEAETKKARPEKAASKTFYEGVGVDDEDSAEFDRADLAKKARAAAKQPMPKPAVEAQKPAEAKAEPVPAAMTAAPAEVPVAEAEIAKGYPVPKPRPRPIEILFADAMNMQIEPAAAPPEPQVWTARKRPVTGHLAATGEGDVVNSISSSKGSLAVSAKPAKAQPPIKEIVEASASEDIVWWPKALTFNQDEEAPQEFVEAVEVQTLASLAQDTGITVTEKDGKSDMLVVNRAAKGDLEVTDTP